MRQFQHSRSYRRQATPHPSRAKRPLIVLIYREGQLQSLYSSTLVVQLVRLDLTPVPSTDLVLNTPESNSLAARQVTAHALAELAPDLRHAAQRAFRQPANS
jgi:hypothetical protein